MFRDSHMFSTFSVDDIEVARRFYGQTLGLEVRDVQEMGIIEGFPQGLLIREIIEPVQNGIERILDFQPHIRGG
jgi:extradiol dioxygenase family protein